MKEAIVSVTAIVCLTVLGVLTKVDSVVYPIAMIIATIAGVYIPRAVNKLRAKMKK